MEVTWHEESEGKRERVKGKVKKEMEWKGCWRQYYGKIKERK